MKRFRSAVESGDLAAIEASLAEDAVLHSPVAFRPYRGRAQVARVIAAVAGVFQDFRYRDELAGEKSYALVFVARVGDKEIEGVDLIEEDAAGLAATLTVFVRPLSATLALAEAMRTALG
jgi:hypothetical protein